MNKLSRGVSCILFGWLLAGAGSRALGQQYPFLPVPGAPTGITLLFQDSRGRLWLGGSELACFDGAHIFFLKNYGFPPVQTYDLAEDPSGAIWIGAETGVYRFGNGHVEQIAQGVAISVIAPTPNVAIAAVGPLGRGVPITTSALMRIERIGKTWKSETVMDLRSPGPLTLAHDGQILYPCLEKGWHELRLEDVIRWRPPGRLAVSDHAVWSLPAAGPVRILRDSNGCMWTASMGQDTFKCGDGAWREAPFQGAGAGANLRETPGGGMLLVGDNFLALGRPGAFRLAKLANGLPLTTSAIQGRDGSIWLAGPTGLFRFASPFSLEYWSPREGVDAPWCLTRSGANVYAGLDRNLAVLSSDRSRWRKLASLGSSKIMNLLPETGGTLLLALNPGTAALLRANGTVVARAAGGEDYYGLRLARTSDQGIWLGGISLGPVKREGSRLTIHNHRLDTQPAGNVLDVQYEEHNNKLWACYIGGLAVRSQDGNWREFTTKDGLLVNACWSLAALPNGDVWYGYYNTPAFALLRPNADGRYTVRQFRAGGDILDPESITFDSDQRGWLWRGGNHGMSVADPIEAEAGTWIHFDQSDGFPGESVNSGSYFADSDGTLWWGNDLNIVHYTPPPDLVHPQFAPQVFVSALSYDNHPPRLAEAVGPLPHGSRITAHIGSLQFDRRNALRIRYRLLPDQPRWRESKNLDLALGRLPTGAHTIEVQGRVFTGPWSATVRHTFTVMRPAALAWPFLAAYFVTAGGLATGGFLLHRRRTAERTTLLPDLSVWRMGALLPDVHDLTGTLLDGRFEVGELLARGGFANVLSGYDREQQRRCAVKVFRREVSGGGDSWSTRSFAREVAALQKIRHPNVVPIYAHGTAPSGAPYLVMEFIEGRNLRETLEAGALAPRRAARVLGQLASALDAIHAAGICHRDVKPENVIIRHEGAPEEEPVLIDFSIAIVKDADETLHGLSRAAGSFDYMAPEQAVGYAEPASDIYSLAKLTIELLTGRRLKQLLPDAALDLPDRARELLRRIGIHLSAESIDRLAAALEFDPARRPRAAGGFAAPLVHDLEL